jgi:hypothetical protein
MFDISIQIQILKLLAQRVIVAPQLKLLQHHCVQDPRLVGMIHVPVAVARNTRTVAAH